MTTMTEKEIIHTYGELYGRLSYYVPVWSNPVRFATSCSSPIKGFTGLYKQALSKRVFTPELENYVAERLNKIDINDLPQEPIPNELQSVFVLGYYKGQKYSADLKNKRD